MEGLSKPCLAHVANNTSRNSVWEELSQSIGVLAFKLELPHIGHKIPFGIPILSILEMYMFCSFGHVVEPD
eukprot:3688186-Amphidinium_carterae.1